MNSGSAPDKMMLVLAGTMSYWSSRNAMHVADDLQRQPGGNIRHEVAQPAASRSSTTVMAARRASSSNLAISRGPDAAGDDPPQPGVPGVVHVDHRPEVLVELDRQVRMLVRALPGGEHSGVLARLDHVRVLHQGVVARALLAERGLGLLEKPRSRLGPKRRRPRRAAGPELAWPDRSIPSIPATVMTRAFP